MHSFKGGGVGSISTSNASPRESHTLRRRAYAKRTKRGAEMRGVWSWLILSIWRPCGRLETQTLDVAVPQKTHIPEMKS